MYHVTFYKLIGSQSSLLAIHARQLTLQTSSSPILQLPASDVYLVDIPAANYTQFTQGTAEGIMNS